MQPSSEEWEPSVDTEEASRSTNTPLNQAQNVFGTTSDNHASNQQPDINQQVNEDTATRSSHLCEVEPASGNDQSPNREHTAPATPESTSNNDTPATSPAVEEANDSPPQDLSDAIGSTLSPEQSALLEKYLGELMPARVTTRRGLD